MERLFRIMSQKAVAAWQRRLVRNHTMNAEERYHQWKFRSRRDVDDDEVVNNLFEQWKKQKDNDEKEK